MPHVIEPAAGADRGTLAFLCEAYHEDEQPDEKGEAAEAGRDAVSSEAGPLQSGRLSADQEGGHARSGPRRFTAN